MEKKVEGGGYVARTEEGNSVMEEEMRLGENRTMR